MWGKLCKIDRIVRPEATQYTCQKYIPAHSLLRDTLLKKKLQAIYTFETHIEKLIPPEWVIMA